jgi:hypothetical protein
MLGDLGLVDPCHRPVSSRAETEDDPLASPAAGHPHRGLVPDVANVVMYLRLGEQVVIAGRHGNFARTGQRALPPAISVADALGVERESPEPIERLSLPGGSVAGWQHVRSSGRHAIPVLYFRCRPAGPRPDSRLRCVVGHNHRSGVAWLCEIDLFSVRRRNRPSSRLARQWDCDDKPPARRVLVSLDHDGTTGSGLTLQAHSSRRALTQCRRSRRLPGSGRDSERLREVTSQPVSGSYSSLRRPGRWRSYIVGASTGGRRRGGSGRTACCQRIMIVNPQLGGPVGPEPHGAADNNAWSGTGMLTIRLGSASGRLVPAFPYIRRGRRGSRPFHISGEEGEGVEP